MTEGCFREMMPKRSKNLWKVLTILNSSRSGSKSLGQSHSNHLWLTLKQAGITGTVWIAMAMSAFIIGTQWAMGDLGVSLETLS